MRFAGKSDDFTMIANYIAPTGCRRGEVGFIEEFRISASGGYLIQPVLMASRLRLKI